MDRKLHSAIRRQDTERDLNGLCKPSKGIDQEEPESEELKERYENAQTCENRSDRKEVLLRS